MRTIGYGQRPRGIPLAVKLGWTFWIAVWAPVYWVEAGFGNFLWLCDMANFVLVAALWLESPLLISSQAVGVLLVQTVWAVDYFGRLLFGVHPIGGTEYMFDPAKPLWLRAFSLFHLVVPPLLVWALGRVGYDRRGWKLQTLLTWALLPATLLLTDPEKNINWLREPFGVPQTWMPPALFLLVAMAAYPLLIYLPTHALLIRWSRRTGRLLRRP